MLYCNTYQSSLVEGVDYLVDRDQGRIKFLSTGRLAGILSDSSRCGVVVTFCCNSDCVYLESYAASCDSACYVQDGYNTVLQEGAEDYKTDDEKMLKRAVLVAEPLPSSSPAPLECEVAFGTQPSCMTWRSIRPLDFECQTEKSAAQHAADHTRPDDSFDFPTWVRGRYLAVRFRITGIGGGGLLSAIQKLVKVWGQHET